MQDKLTEKGYWDEYWKAVELPLEISHRNSPPNICAELDVFEHYLPAGELEVLEIGGAPGQYLVWFHKKLGYKVSCLDYSEKGCEKTRENFRLLKIPGRVYCGDLFSDALRLPRFDLVCSFGFVEHFSNLTEVVSRHMDLLKPGGLLVLGVPNLTGINHWFLKRLDPDLLAAHNLKSMDAENWDAFEKRLGLEMVFKQYIGGFEPAVFLKCSRKSLRNRMLFLVARVLHRIFHNNLKGLRKYNSKKFSGYLMGIYRKPH